MAEEEYVKDPVQTAVARVAAASRKKHRSGVRISVQRGLLREAREELVRARLERAIDKALYPEKPYPKLLKADRLRLAKVLRDGRWPEGEEDRPR